MENNESSSANTPAPFEGEKIERQRRDPEDIFDEVATSGLQIAGRYAWPVAERVFKLAAWLFVCAAVIAIGRETDQVEIKILGSALAALWFAAAISSAFVAVGFLQDAARDRWLNGREEHNGKTLLIDFAITALTVFPMIQLFFSALSVAGAVMAYLVETGLK